MSRDKMQLTTELHSQTGELRIAVVSRLNVAHHRSHSLAGEPRTGTVSRVQIQLNMEATHFLKRQGQAS